MKTDLTARTQGAGEMETGDDMTFQDIFKSSFLENADAISVLDMAMTMVLAFLVGLFIFFIYKRTYSGVMYSASFGVTLIALTLITALLIMAVTSNIILSLGMVGALSIVRFRTAIKDPVDIAFLFWSIAAGIVLAAGFLPLAVFGSLFIGLILLIFSSQRGEGRPYILIVTCACREAEEQVKEIVKNSVKAFSLKSKTVTSGRIELNYEVRLKDEDSDFINALAGTENVTDAVLVSYNGDYMG